ncbi:MAG: formate--tetrahydrofolate ligase [Planctomycetota bacterium]
MPTDLSIARAATLRPILEIAESIGLSEGDLEPYGRHKAKVRVDDVRRDRAGKLILVSAITPTPAGEGKTTLTVGLGQALARIGKRGAIAIREPSLGPCMGMKGGATGGGHSQVLPMEDINLHFTGDLHAITSAHNLLAAMMDNNMYFWQDPHLDARRATWKRVMDMNDRALRSVVVGLGGPTDGVPRETGFDITAASEVMAALCLSEDMADLKARMGRFIVGFDGQDQPVTAQDLGAVGAMAALLRNAIEPNLVQTLEGTPAFVHGGPFANIAHGTSSVRAAKLALRLADYVVTEAGFGFDLGAEKFFDIFCRSSGLSPSCVVLIATVRALKMHGGVKLKELGREDPDAVERGLPNLEKHLETLSRFSVPALVAVNRFTSDTDAEIEVILRRCKELGVAVEIADVWSKGGQGGTAVAERMVEIADACDTTFEPLYELDASVQDKILAVASQVYGAQAVDYTPGARKDLARIERLGLSGLPVCIAKTQKSLSDNPKLLGRPKDFVVTVREFQIAAGAGFLIPITGEIMRMPGLPRHPAALDIDVLPDGTLEGLA